MLITIIVVSIFFFWYINHAIKRSEKTIFKGIERIRERLEMNESKLRNIGVFGIVDAVDTTEELLRGTEITYEMKYPYGDIPVLKPLNEAIEKIEKKIGKLEKKK